jgi:hypothetical protein
MASGYTLPLLNSHGSTRKNTEEKMIFPEFFLQERLSAAFRACMVIMPF